MTKRTSAVRPYPDCPLVVAYGLGVDSTALLVEFAQRGIRPDLILFADTGGEKPETYAYLPVIQDYLAGVGSPPVVTVRYAHAGPLPHPRGAVPAHRHAALARLRRQELQSEVQKDPAGPVHPLPVLARGVRP
jgi:hypothetical protein